MVMDYIIEYALFVDFFGFAIHGKWALDDDQSRRFIREECENIPDYEELGVGA